MDINVGFLVSYDYKYLKTSIPLIYDSANSITLAIDVNKKTWANELFTIEPSFFDWIKEFDTQNKIIIYEDDFYVKELTTFECETRERKLLAEQMGFDGWVIQLDADEFFLDFESFCTSLQKYNYLFNKSKKIQIATYMLSVYKLTNNGILYFEKPVKFYLGTNKNSYKKARNCKSQTILIKAFVVHYTWSRTEDELLLKFNNFGHNTDFDIKKYIKFWRSIDETNYKNHTYFHPFIKKGWKNLNYCNGKNINEVVENLKTKNFEISNFEIKFKNLKQYLKFLIKK